MKKTIFPIFIAFAVIISSFGCTQLSQPVGAPPYSTQMKIQSVYYWDIIAHDIAFRLNRELIERDYLERLVMVSSGFRQTGDSLPFDEAFKGLLTTHLVGFGVPTVITPDDESLRIEYGVQVVSHETGRYRRTQPSPVVSLAETVFAGHKTTKSGTKNTGDDWNAFIINGHYEVIITTSVLDIDNNSYVFRDSSVYYINDLYNFIPPPDSEKKFQEEPLPVDVEVEMVSFEGDQWL
jgi:hypothetical protein